MKKVPKKRTKLTLEQQYEKIVSAYPATNYPSDDNQSLIQPSAYQLVQTFVTYGAYEDPV